MDWFLYDQDLRHEELTKLNKFKKSQDQKILISHDTFQYLWVSPMVE